MTDNNATPNRVPSREVVEVYFKRGPKEGMFTDWVREGHVMLRALLAEVGRTKDYDALAIRVLLQLATIERLERTVADQAAALAERDKDAERYLWLRDIGNETWAALANRSEPFSYGSRPNADKVDAAIDAALASQPEKCVRCGEPFDGTHQCYPLPDTSQPSISSGAKEQEEKGR